MAGAVGRRITVGRVRLDAQAGIGLPVGQGSDPVLMCEFSNDGGHTWGAESFVRLGELGDYTHSVNLYAFANGYQVKFRIKCSDPVPLTIWGGAVYMRDDGVS